MSEAEMLEQVKKGLGIIGTFHDGILLRHIQDVKAFCISAGMSQEVIHSDASIGLLIRGVSDVWTQDSGKTSFSLLFMQRLVQLIIASNMAKE